MRLTKRQLAAIHAKNQDSLESKHHIPHGDPNAHPINCVSCGRKSISAYMHGGVCSKACQERLIRNSSFPNLIKTRFGINARNVGVK